MSIGAYGRFCGRYKPYHLLDGTIESEKAGDFADYGDFIAGLRVKSTTSGGNL
jgi:hypothetical protein